MRKIISFIGLALVSTALHADAIYTTFGATNSFSSFAYGAHLHAESAFEFVAGTTNQVSSIDAVLFTYQGVGSVAKIVLANDASGLPGTAIETFNFSGLTDSPTLVSSVSTLHPLLTSGTGYWLELYTVDASINVLWSFSDQPLTAAGAASSSTDFDVTPTVWTVNRPGAPPAFDVQGVPEPSTLLMTIAPLALGLLVARRKSQEAARVAVR